MKINPFEMDENMNYIHCGENNGRDISYSSFHRSKSNLVRFRSKEAGSRRVKGKPFSWKGIHTRIYIY